MQQLRVPRSRDAGLPNETHRVAHFTDSEVNSLTYNMWAALEEGMEMTGVIVFIYALLNHSRGTPDQVARSEVGVADSEA